MVEYNPKDWLKSIFSFHRAETFSKLFPLMLTLAVYSGLVAYVINVFFHLDNNHPLKNIAIIHSLLGFVISMLLVFRTNTAYERWWEGRKLWGALVNNSRNLAIKLCSVKGLNAEQKVFFDGMISDYAFALKNHLRNVVIKEEFVLFKHQDTINHVPNKIALQLVKEINTLYEEGIIKQEQFLSMNTEIISFTDICGACERIKKTPIPFSYSSFLKKFIFFYVLSMPFGYVFSMGYVIIPVVVFIFYALASLELIAEEIEDPFGTDANDLPTDNIASTIRLSVSEIFKNS